MKSLNHLPFSTISTRPPPHHQPPVVVISGKGKAPSEQIQNIRDSKKIAFPERGLRDDGKIVKLNA
jgi:hypothetical protein